MAGYWFKPKTNGYGATPSNWKGWAALYVYAFFVTLAGFRLIAVPAKAQGLKGLQVLSGLAVIGALTVCFVAIARHKTDGEWRWRWRGKG